MSLDKAFCLVHLLNTEEPNKRLQTWLFDDHGKLLKHMASGTLDDLNQALMSSYRQAYVPVVVLTPNGKCSIKSVSINKGQLKFARQVIESTLEPLLASDVQDTHFEFVIEDSMAQVCVVDKQALAAWRDVIVDIKGTVIGLYAIESIISEFGSIEESKGVEFSDMAFVRSKDHIASVPPSVLSLLQHDIELRTISGPDIANMLRTGTPVLNLANKKAQSDMTSMGSVLTSWYALPSIISLVLFIVLEVGVGVLSQKTKAIDDELARSYKLLFPDERIVSLHRQLEYKFNALKVPKTNQAPKTAYGIFVALEKTTQSLIGQHAIESMDYARGQYSVKWKTENRSQLDQIRQSLIRQGVSITLESWQRTEQGFVGNYLIQGEDKL